MKKVKIPFKSKGETDARPYGVTSFHPFTFSIFRLSTGSALA